jgi:hypothetical protein
MAEPTCPECKGHDFDSKQINARDDSISLVYCTNCGHIVGCVAWQA